MTSRIKKLAEKGLMGNAPEWMHHTVQYDPGFASVYLVEKANTLAAMGYVYDENA